MERKRTSRLRISPDHIENLNQDEIFVFGSNLEGHHAGGAANYAFKRFGAIWGEGDGLTGQSYAIPTMHGGIDAIKPYIDKFISYAKNHKGKKFLVTRIGCGIAGFYDNQMAPLFKEAIKLDNVFLPRRWVEILLADKKIQEFLGEALDDCDFYRLHAVREDDLIKLSEKYRPQILKGDKSNLPKIKVSISLPMKNSVLQILVIVSCFVTKSCMYLQTMLNSLMDLTGICLIAISVENVNERNPYEKYILPE